MRKMARKAKMAEREVVIRKNTLGQEVLVATKMALIYRRSKVTLTT